MTVHATLNSLLTACVRRHIMPSPIAAECRHNACLVQLSEEEVEVLDSAIAMCKMLALETVAERPPEFVASGPDSPGFCALPGR